MVRAILRCMLVEEFLLELNRIYQYTQLAH